MTVLPIPPPIRLTFFEMARVVAQVAEQAGTWTVSPAAAEAIALATALSAQLAALIAAAWENEGTVKIEKTRRQERKGSRGTRLSYRFRMLKTKPVNRVNWGWSGIPESWIVQIS